MIDRTPRLGLPVLATGQAQKEVTHNEALVLLDALAQPVVEAVAPAAIPASPEPGQCWIVGAGAGGVWTGHDHEFAIWTEGGWRFAASRDGMQAWSLADRLLARRGANGWVVGSLDAMSVRIGGQQVLGMQQPAIANAAGGTTVDTEARLAISSILDALRAHGLVSR